MHADSEYELRLRRRIVQPQVAFLTACLFSSVLFLVASVLGQPNTSAPDLVTETGLMLGMFVINLIAVVSLLAFSIAFVACVPALIAVFLMRRIKAVRGLADMVAGGLIGGLASFVVPGNGLHFLVEGMPEIFFFAANGLLAGLVYWFLAGRPRPPYSHA